MALVLDLDETLVQMGPLHEVLLAILRTGEMLSIEAIELLMRNLGSLRSCVPMFLARIATCRPCVPVVLYTDAIGEHLPYVAAAITLAVNRQCATSVDEQPPWCGFAALLTGDRWYTGPNLDRVKPHVRRAHKDLREVEEIVFGGTEMNLLFLDDRPVETVRICPSRHRYLKVVPYMLFPSNPENVWFQILLIIPAAVARKILPMWAPIWRQWRDGLKETMELLSQTPRDDRGVGASMWFRTVDAWVRTIGVVTFTECCSSTMGPACIAPYPPLPQ